jgi:nucleoside-diphosphate-sugar epimerase
LTSLSNIPMNLVLITGATGHVGFRTLVHSLQAGYQVRAAVRSAAKADRIASHPLIQALNSNGTRLSFTIVPDLATPNAYDTAAHGVSYIIHIASPMTCTSQEIALNEQDAYFIQPAVQGTLNILSAAQKAGTVRRIVITSSLTALVTIDQLTGIEPTTSPVQASTRIPFTSGPYESNFAAYSASKVAALAAAESWSVQTQPAFDVIHLHPSFVQGRNDLALTPKAALHGTNALVLGAALGKQFHDSIAGATVHVEDVAQAHVSALNTWLVPGDRSYILSRAMQWEDVASYVTRLYPWAVQKRLLLLGGGHIRSHPVPIDASESELMLGIRFRGLEEQVRSVVGHFLEVRLKGRRDQAVARENRPRASIRIRANA